MSLYTYVYNIYAYTYVYNIHAFTYVYNIHAYTYVYNIHTYTLNAHIFPLNICVIAQRPELENFEPLLSESVKLEGSSNRRNLYYYDLSAFVSPESAVTDPVRLNGLFTTDKTRTDMILASYQKCIDANEVLKKKRADDAKKRVEAQKKAAEEAKSAASKRTRGGGSKGGGGGSKGGGGGSKGGGGGG